ncbi:hypothetical protein AZE42_07194 [Rhizopogon vesiculosus]|uniref:Uncharacterized protein n=1 Tax=Rhizopogon vesiculosus TaxID=180088 RepID=A0A1J8PRA0_9AGAM|nr:hypothetical protein AZE42_07194 [Rhizopogon vesiculosus]
MEVISSLNLEVVRVKINGTPTDLPDDPNTMHRAFEIMHSASWRERYP